MSDDPEQVPYVFPYRVVLVYDDGREELLDPAYLPLPIDPKDPNDGGAANARPVR
jgi:hypothetical protein